MCETEKSDIQRGKIGRTVKFSHLVGFKAVDGELVEASYDLIGDYSRLDRATGALRRRLRDPSIIITSAQVDEDYYSMPIELFVTTAINYQKETNHE